MHVSWDHIKQRPHFVAEFLQETFDVHVYALRHVSTSHTSLVTNDVNSVQVDTLTAYNVPGVINDLWGQHKLRKSMQESRVVWLTSPRMLGFIKPLLDKRHIVVYDCMDDILEFPDLKSDVSRQKKVFSLEQDLVRRADVIFCSSDFLRQKLIQRYGQPRITVVNNAVNVPCSKDIIVSLPPHVEKAFAGPRRKIVYIGTISEWFDFDIVKKSLEQFEDIEYLLVGCLDTPMPSHDRIKYLGPIEHKYVFPLMKQADILVMPFLLTELIMSVNPVKVYEYISSGKPALVKRYPETEKFSEFVYLYESHQDYLRAIQEIADNGFHGRQGSKRCLEYMESNTWGHRVPDMVAKMARVMGKDQK
jgi:teichuronic acid biosynthesis glycosyltransferase TuaH